MEMGKLESPKYKQFQLFEKHASYSNHYYITNYTNRTRVVLTNPPLVGLRSWQLVEQKLYTIGEEVYQKTEKHIVDEFPVY